MLRDVLLSYEAVADATIPNWRNANKNDLIRECVANKNNKDTYNNYVSAIIARYWSLATKFYYKNSSSVTPDECYGWLLDSILYALDKEQWNDPTKAVYNDPNGPDKVINRCMVSARLMFYQASNCENRKINYNVYSSDKLQEELGDSAFPAVDDDDLSLVSDVIEGLVKKAFNKGDYFSCAVIDTIAYKETYDTVKESGSIFTQFNPKKLAKNLRKCDDAYCDKFFKRYHVTSEEAREQITSIKRFSTDKMYRWIDRTLRKLRDSRAIQEMFE